MTILREQAERILRAAQEARVGIQIRVLENTDEDGKPIVAPSLRVKQTLYRFRQEINDAELKNLQIRLCPNDPDHRLWITKGEREKEREQEREQENKDELATTDGARDW